HKNALAISEADLAKRFPEYAALGDQVRRAVAAREKERPRPLETLSVFVETDPNPPVHHVLKRGQHNAPGRAVQPGVPAAFCSPANTWPQTSGVAEKKRQAASKGAAPSTGARTALARWITSPANPLFARVMVNRIWQHHFGTGLVSTPDNLGKSGTTPSHPELVDYLAWELVRSGWSVKAIHRLIVKSAVYRQGSTPSRDAGSLDPEDRLLWHFPLRRLDAEALRDAMLAISGEIDPDAGGP